MNIKVEFLIFIAINAVLIFLVLYLQLLMWLAARKVGVKISLLQVFFMKIRKMPVKDILNTLIVAKKADLNISSHELEAIILSGGNIINVVYGLVAAKNAQIKLTLQNAIKGDKNNLHLLRYIKERVEEKNFSEIIFK